MSTIYYIERRIVSDEADDVVPWIDHNRVFSLEAARSSLAWNQANTKVTTTGKPLKWRIRKLTNEVVE